jgi:hypothetical protein
MLAYLEELCTALLAHDSAAVQRLLGHPLARALPRQVREEAMAIIRANPSSLRAPIQVLRFYHQTLQLGEPGWNAASEVGEASAADTGEHVAGAISDHSDRGVATLVSAATHGPARDCLDQIELPLEVVHSTHAVAA